MLAARTLAAPEDSAAGGEVPPLPPLPRWLERVDGIVIAVLNVMLAAEVVLVFATTMQRTLSHSSSMMWVDEVSPLFLVTLAFLGGAVAYGHGQFIAIKVVLDRMPLPAQRFLSAATEWIAIAVSVLIGGWS